jgi:hypothetical protein
MGMRVLNSARLAWGLLQRLVLPRRVAVTPVTPIQRWADCSYSREHVLRGGKSGRVALPGIPDQSLLTRRVSFAHEKLKTPTDGKFTDEQIADLRTRIAGRRPLGRTGLWRNSTAKTIRTHAGATKIRHFSETPPSRFFSPYSPAAAGARRGICIVESVRPQPATSDSGSLVRRGLVLRN